MIRLVEDSEIHFQVRDGRLHHDGQRVGFPEIDPDLVISSRGSIGIDETLDLYLEMPWLRKGKRDKGPLQAHVTGTIREPKIAIQDAPLVIRSRMARRIVRVYAWAFRTGLLGCSLRCAALWASLSHSNSCWQFLQSSLTRKFSKSRRRLGRTLLCPLTQSRLGQSGVLPGDPVGPGISAKKVSYMPFGWRAIVSWRVNVRPKG